MSSTTWTGEIPAAGLPEASVKQKQPATRASSRMPASSREIRAAAANRLPHVNQAQAAAEDSDVELATTANPQDALVSTAALLALLMSGR